jgi:hypothetical protein
MAAESKQRLTDAEQRARAILDGQPSLLAKLFAGGAARPLRVTEFPGTTTPVGLWELKRYEADEATIDAVAFLESIKIPDAAIAADPTIADAERRVQILFRALRDPQAPERPFCGSPTELRTLLTADQIDALFDQYLDLLEERNPKAKLRSPEEVDGLISVWGKLDSTARASICSYDGGSLRSIALLLAARCLKQMQASSSPASFSNDSSASTGPTNADG